MTSKSKLTSKDQTTKMDQIVINELPPELLTSIFSFLSFTDLKTSLLVCR